MPVSAKATAKSGKLGKGLSQPIRIFTLTGTFTACTTAAATAQARSGVFNRPLPSPLLATLGTGQPILMSMARAPWSTAIAAPSAIIAGSAPKI